MFMNIQSLNIQLDSSVKSISFNPEFYGLSGNIFPNFFLEYGNLIYYYNDSYKCSTFSKELITKDFLHL